MPAQTIPFQVVVGTEIVPQQPFAHLYQHIRQRDPKLSETLDRLSQPANIQSNLSNPLQCFTFILPSPSPGDKTANYAEVMSNVPNDMNMYFPISLDGNVVTPSSTDIQIDIQISHDGGVNFISLLAAPFIIGAGNLIPTSPTVTFAQGAYLRNRDIVYGQLTSGAFTGSGLTFELLFQ